MGDSAPGDRTARIDRGAGVCDAEARCVCALQLSVLSNIPLQHISRHCGSQLLASKIESDMTECGLAQIR